MKTTLPRLTGAGLLAALSFAVAVLVAGCYDDPGYYPPHGYYPHPGSGYGPPPGPGHGDPHHGPGHGGPGHGGPGHGGPGHGGPGHGGPPPGGFYSDAALKDQVTDYGRGLDEIREIRTVSYRYAEGNPVGLPSEDRHVGVIAQEVENTIPEAVTRDSSGYRKVDATPIFWSAINAIQELEKENQALKARIEALEKKAAEIP